MKFNTIGGLAVSALLIAAPLSVASAADMPVKAPLPAPPPAYSWTGFYIGGNGGWAWERVSGTSNFLDTTLTGVSASNPQSNSFSNSGGIFGGQIGYNWQVAKWVLGVEGDWDWVRTNYSQCRQTDTTSLACIDNEDGFQTLGGRTDWLATARGRVGVTWDRFMFYGTGGAAWARIETTDSLSCFDGCGASSHTEILASSTVTQTKTGWVAGLGAEGMIDAHWSVKAEWLYVDLGNTSVTLTTLGSAGTQSGVWSHNDRIDLFRVGLNYRFGG
jgi:outer membrane immunogenic protein